MDASGKKELIVAITVALYTIAFFSIAAFSFRGAQAWSLSFGSFLGIAGILWVSLFAIGSALLAQKKPVARSLATVPSLALIAGGAASGAAMAGAAILFGLTLGAQSSITKELEGHIKIRIATVFSFGVRLLFFGMLISCIVLAIPTVRKAIADGEVGIPEEYIRSIAKPVLPTLAAIHPSYTIDTVGVQLNEYIRHQANNEQLWVTVVIIAVALLAIRTVVPLISVVALGCIAILFAGLKSAGLFRVTEREVPVESIEL